MLRRARRRLKTPSCGSSHRAAVTLFALVGLMFVLSACGSNTTESTVIGENSTVSVVGQPAPRILTYENAPYIITVSNNELNSTKLEVPASQGVLFVNAENDSKTQHRFVADDGSFDTNVLDPGGQYYVTFSGMGTIAFHDALDTDITGEIVITTADTSYTVMPSTGAWISIGQDGLSSAKTTVRAGETVSFYNAEDDNPVDHHIVADDDSFDTGVLSPGDSYSVLFEATGTYSFHDELDSSIEGTITIE